MEQWERDMRENWDKDKVQIPEHKTGKSVLFSAAANPKKNVRVSEGSTAQTIPVA